MTKSAREQNRSPDEVMHVLPVPLIDARQMHYLQKIADAGIIDETPEEVAAFMILEGIDKRLRSGMIEGRTDWKGFKP
jgi:hypothetical protein